MKMRQLDKCLGKASAKQNPDFIEGRPKKFSKAQLDLAMDLLKTDTTKNVSRKTGISKATLYREKRRRKYQNL
jgi:hypothetical protein